MLEDAIKSLRDFQEHMKTVWEDPEFQEQCRQMEEKWRRELAQAENTLKPIIKPGDLIRVGSCHSADRNVYEVSRIESDGPISQPACFKHSWSSIMTVYRYDEVVDTYVSIWKKGWDV